jgi:RNA polymerase sigma-B factor
VFPNSSWPAYFNALFFFFIAMTRVHSPQPRRSLALATPQLRQRNRRVEAYHQLVRPLAVHYAQLSRESSEDLQQAGMLGLIRAAELYSQERQTPFEAFARPHIRGAILHYLRDVSPLVRLPRRQAELQDRVMQWQRQQGPGLSAAAMQATMQRQLGLSPGQWLLLERNWAMNRPASLEPEMLEDLASEEESGLPESATPPMALGAMLDVLDSRQQLIVRRVVLEGWSYRKIAAELGVSPMTVQRQLRKGLEHLRQHLDGVTEEHPWSPPKPMRSQTRRHLVPDDASVPQAC